MKETIRNVIKLILNNREEAIDSISLNEPLKNIGMNSINYMQMVLLIEDYFNIKFKVEDCIYEEMDTIEKIINIINKYRKEEDI